MTTVDLEHIEWVRALDVPPGAILAVKCATRITAQAAEEIQARVEEALPGRPVLILGPDMDLIVVRDEREDDGT